MNKDVIISDRFERLQILDFLWTSNRARTQRNSGEENSPNISNSLKIEEVKVQSHLETLEDLGLITINLRTRGGWLVKIRGNGTTCIEDFFINLENEFRKSKNTEIKNHVQKIDHENDRIRKHEFRMQFLMTVQEGFKLANNLLTKLGL